MTADQSLINDLVAARPFIEAVEAAMGEEAGELFKGLRAAARSGEGEKAAWYEGQIVALENVVPILKRFANRGIKQG